MIETRSTTIYDSEGDWMGRRITLPFRKFLQLCSALKSLSERKKKHLSAGKIILGFVLDAPRPPVYETNTQSISNYTIQDGPPSLRRLSYAHSQRWASQSFPLSKGARLFSTAWITTNYLGARQPSPFDVTLNRALGQHRTCHQIMRSLQPSRFVPDNSLLLLNNLTAPSSCRRFNIDLVTSSPFIRSFGMPRRYWVSRVT
ncbi:uncharacterized protein MYCFIDRAFT_173055 [Pseudocercospora fijiensis CIRAD86]|uniref:Uncharacterized protein n=1 Tax=Pseudocercospora fijiensis (strain CIRAD86) TaxID=383855 RepID=M2ZYG9_PSEFD|nr:uncharacterized protein MYCFIDRAFT_173055 [Pseudocercospora fijiensis CIRAD86]EME83994.1 hypothetical protein MYCFIDRAFT_173055 [Pseudocercospora fijiensis CIRAD86]